VGTGTGILAIAAVKLGALSATGIDIDEWSIDNARENVLQNDLQSRVSISTTLLPALQPRSFNLLTANLTLNTILENIDEFGRVLRRGGILLLSGLLSTDAHHMIQQLTSHGFKFVEEKIENEWIALAARMTA